MLVPDISYSVVEEVGWPTMIEGGIGRSYAVERIGKLMPAQVPTLHEVSQLLNSHSREEPLTRAIRKLGDAEGRTHDGERALDLGACLEILLMHGKGDNGFDNTEIGYKLRMRAAWLLGRDAVSSPNASHAGRSGFLPVGRKLKITSILSGRKARALRRDAGVLRPGLCRKMEKDRRPWAGGGSRRWPPVMRRLSVDQTVAQPNGSRLE